MKRFRSAEINEILLPTLCCQGMLYVFLNIRTSIPITTHHGHLLPKLHNCDTYIHPGVSRLDC